MKHLILITFMILLRFDVAAQVSGIQAGEAAKHIGQNVHVTATVTSVRLVKSSNSIIVRLSDGKDQQELLTLIIHQEQYSPTYSNWLLSLKTRVITFGGKISIEHGQPIIKGEAKNMVINTVDAFSNRPALVITAISAKNAARYIGKQVSVCDTAYDYKVSGDSIFISIGAVYPYQTLTLVASRRYISRADTMQGKAVCFEGIITLYQNKPRITATGWQQNRQRVR